MRLESGKQLPDGLVLLLRFQYLVILALVLVGIWVWVPPPEDVPAVARPGLVLAAAFIWYASGLSLLRVAEGRATLLPGLLLYNLLPLSVSLLALLLEPLHGASLLLLAVAIQGLPERLPSIAAQWPVAWLIARRQQNRLLLVALASIVVALWYPEHWSLG